MKRRVEYDGKTYAVKSDKIEIPDFDSMSRIEILMWLNQKTYAQGRSTRKPTGLEGLGDVLNLSIR